MFDVIKTGHKVVDRWYSFHQNSFGICGVGEIVKVSRKKGTMEIKFQDKTITYDKAHVDEFIVPYKRGMRKKYEGKVIPK